MAAWVVAGLVVAVTVVVIVATTVAGGDGDEAKIRAVAGKFSDAVQNEDQATIVRLLCTEEAAAVTDDDDYDPADGAGVTTRHASLLRPHVSDIRVAGEVARARVTPPFQRPATLYFQKERGTWKVCAPAATRFPRN